MDTGVIVVHEFGGYTISLHKLLSEGKTFYAVYVVCEGKNIFEGFYPEMGNAISDYHNMQDIYFGRILDKYKRS